MKLASTRVVFLSVLGLVLLGQAASAQGPLAPPAGPQPMMKTLQEMEPRTHIAAAGYVITAPGSYYLTSNLNGGGSQTGITVQASGVTIDLRGFSIENCLVGISATSGIRNVAVANGIVRDCANTGVDLSGAAQCRLEGVMFAANGVDGARAGAGSLITLCTASGNGGLGMILGDNGTVFRCVVQNNANGGITIGSNCQATENTLTGNGSTTGQAGLVTIGSNNRVEGNSANYNNGQGFLINGSGNLVIRNNACNNTIADYQFASGNNYGQVLVAPGAGFASSNAWANFGCGGCQSAAECDDANPCTEDACVASACVSTPVPGCGPCQTAAECDDGNPCTEDICQAELCVHDPIPDCGAPICGNGILENGEVCDDGNMINGDGCSVACQQEVCGNGILDPGETCDDGNMINGDGCSTTCQIEGGGDCAMDSQCDDNNPCTMDLCIAGACQFTISPDGTPCNDGNACTSGEVCINGACTSSTPLNCDDGDPCTIDSCDGMGGCTHTPIPNCGQACTDGSTQPCWTGTSGSPAAGICQMGIQTCSGGQWGACIGQILPQTEVCDGLDNDCDGILDEDQPTYTCGVGACQVTISSCVGGASQACVPGMPSMEVCDGIDNDCDGLVDEEGVCNSVCGNGLTEVGETCDDANTFNGDGCSATCLVEPEFSCSGSPSICTIPACIDGNTQSCYTGLPGTEGVGPCQGGIQTCFVGAWGACEYQVLPAGEMCDGMDNDCDGLIDEDFNLGASCSTGLPGICGSGVTSCGFNGLAVCAPNIAPGSQTEVCDGIDNDCDGMIDEDGVCNAACGNGIVEVGEVCDDANQVNGDGCSAVCTVESGYSCAGSPSICTPAASCMDGIQNGTETGVDCGGGACAPCANGQGCNAGSDCQSGVCVGGVCVTN